MSNRRRLLIVLGAAALAPEFALAQSKSAPLAIGWLNGGSRESTGQFVAAFREELAALGWKEGSQVVIEERWADGRSERLQPLAQELAAKKPAVIIALGLRAVRAATKAAPKTPIVMIAGDPVAAGLAASLARPGGMVTGVTNVAPELTEKHLELLLAAAPKLRRVGFMWDPGTLTAGLTKEAVLRSVARHSVDARFAEVAHPEEIEAAISRLEKEGVQALVVSASQGFLVERRRIVKLALAHRRPVIAAQREWADEGALLTYGPDSSASYRRAAYYVDKIIRGAKPGDLPIEQPTKFELVINMKTAKALGLNIPQDLRLRADRVIE